MGADIVRLMSFLRLRYQAVLIFSAFSLLAFVSYEAVSRQSLPPAAGAEETARKVVSRGRIEPVERVRTIQGPSNAILRKLYVHDGSLVEADALLAETDQRASALASVALEEKRLIEAERALLQVTAPAKRSELEAQQAVIRQRESEWKKLQRDYGRAVTLAAQHVISAEVEETRYSAMQQAEAALRQAESSWRALTETRDVDAMAAAARVDVQKAVLNKARAELDLTQIHAPISGTILMVMVREGEALGNDGLLQMADLSNLEVVAEVDESDIGRASLGQKATISGAVLPLPISGRVTRLSQAVFKQKRPTSDVLIGRDARIVEVEIQPDAPLPAVVGGEVSVMLSVSP